MNIFNPRISTSYSRETVINALLVAVGCVVNLLIIFGGPFPWINDVSGFLLAIGLPAWMLSQKVNWLSSSPVERLAYGVVCAILGLMLVGLCINTMLPYVGVSRPLDRGPVLVAVDVWCIIVALWRPHAFNPRIPRPRIDELDGVDWLIGLLSGVCVPLAIVGANRLNNGAGSGVTMTMLVLAATTLALMFGTRERLNPGTITASIYFIALALLLMTSLRGWYITGHDIQQEYYVFELTKNNAYWNFGVDQDAYNACLSLTILPTMLWQLMRIDDPYIFKLWFQLLFALCPLFVYRISLRYTSKMIAIIATIYFVAFPAFFTDMPFLNRQEVAWLFVGAGMMIATTTSRAISLRAVQLRIGLFSLGAVLSHYSTSYVFLATIAIGWVIFKLITRFRSVQRDERDIVRAKPVKLMPSVSLQNIVFLLIVILLWNGAATHTVNGLADTVSQAVQSLRGGSDGAKSADVSYSLFGGGAPSPEQVLTNYMHDTLQQTGSQADRAVAGFYSQTELSKYPLTTSYPLANLPVTPFGHLFNDVGLNVTTLNSVIRSGAAKLLQVFVILGLASALLRWRKRRSRRMIDLISLSCGAFFIVALQVVLPGVSADYGVLRAFQQALIVFGPLVAVGSFAVFRFLDEKWRARATFGLSIVFFTSLVGIIPQMLGGYPAQLNLNNSGQYYEIYYTRPQSIVALEWLHAKISARETGGSQPEVQMDRFTYRELMTYTSLHINSTNYPTLLKRSSYVFLGYQTVATGKATIFTGGDLITYPYPVKLLNSSANLIYSSNGAMIYG